MSKFKVGDKVIAVSANRRGYVDDMKYLLGKTLVVRAFSDAKGDEFVLAGPPRKDDWYWHPDDLRMATAEEIKAATPPKPLRRGDLVMHRGQIGVVHEIDPDGEDGYWVAMLTGDAICVCRGAEDLTRIGSIRKKVKWMKAAIAKAGG